MKVESAVTADLGIPWYSLGIRSPLGMNLYDPDLRDLRQYDLAVRDPGQQHFGLHHIRQCRAKLGLVGPSCSRELHAARVENVPGGSAGADD